MHNLVDPMLRLGLAWLPGACVPANCSLFTAVCCAVLEPTVSGGAYSQCPGILLEQQHLYRSCAVLIIIIIVRIQGINIKVEEEQEAWSMRGIAG